MNNIPKQFSQGFGLKLEPLVKEDAIFGSIFPDKEPPFDWRPFLPEQKERQFNSFFCTNFSYTNCLETMHRKEGRNEINFSDRWSVVKSGTTLTGNTPKKVWEAGRKSGNVLEAQCLWKPEWLDDPEKYWNEIQKLPEDIDIIPFLAGPNYSFVKPKLEWLKSALAHSPLNIGIQVGETYQNEIITPPKEKYGGHAVLLAFIDQFNMYIYDSYPPFLKKLTLDYPIMVAGSFAKLPDNWKILNEKNWLIQLLKSFRDLFK